MKNYSPEERATAIKKLPRPASYFVGSKRLYEIYKGIGRKLNLTQRQFMLMAEIAGVTLIGLEPESALEANIHYLMPELSNATAKELVLDIQDRVLKESQRRVKEEVFEQDSFVPTEMGLTPEQELERQREFTIDAMDDDDPELLKLIEEEKAAREKREAEEAKELEQALVESQKPRPQALSASEASLGFAEAEATRVADSPISAPNPIPTIATQKLAVPTAQQANDTQVDSVLGRPSVAAISLPTTPETALERKATSLPPLTKTDPYREPVN
jgi:hypothetical protein